MPLIKGGSAVAVKAAEVTSPVPSEVETDKTVSAEIEKVAKKTAKQSVLQPKTLDDKSKQIQKQGIWQAVVQSNALVQYAPTLDAYLDLVDRAADRGLAYVNSER